MLVKARRTQGSSGFYSVFVCADRYGNKMLRQMENPAHNEWTSKNWRNAQGHIEPRGREILDELEKFIIDVQQRLFADAQKEVMQIKGLDDFLYIPTAVDDDEEASSESLMGDPVDQHHDDDEHAALSTDLGDARTKDAEDGQAMGKVIIETSTDTPQKADPTGKQLSGHGTKKKKTRGGGGASGRRLEGHYGDNADGVDGKFMTEIPVAYRAYAQTEGGETVHYLVVHSEYEVENGRLDLLVGGEQSDDRVTIRSCTPEAIVHENTLSGLTLRVGRNLFKVCFPASTAAPPPCCAPARPARSRASSSPCRVRPSTRRLTLPASCR